MKNSGATIAKRIICIVSLAFIGVTSFLNRGCFTDSVYKFFTEKNSFSSMTEDIAESYTSDNLIGKSRFIDLNGLFARISGKQVHNQISLMQNGMLTNVEIFEEEDQTGYVSSMISDDAFLKREGIPFLYVQAPYKVPTDEDLLPAGMIDKANSNADAFIEGITKAGVNNIDLRHYMSKDADQIEKYIYRTDHHWTPDGAFYAFQLIMDELETVTGEPLDKTYTDASRWERHSIDDWFLGSQGKRVGQFFDGTDPLIYYTPLFDTEMSLSIPNHGELLKGDFNEANIRSQYIEKKDYYNYNPYCVYIGGEYPIVYHRNPDAPNKKKLLLLKDSYMLPLQAFMSTEFTEVTVVDPRYYTASSIAEIIHWIQPDCVMVLKTRCMTEPFVDWGVDSFVDSGPGEVLISDYDVDIPLSDSDYNYKSVPVDLRKGNTYYFSFSDLTVTDGNTDGFSVILYDPATERIMDQQAFDIDFSNLCYDRSWTFRISDDAEDHNYELLLYSGIAGKTSGIGIKCSGVSLKQE